MPPIQAWQPVSKDRVSPSPAAHPARTLRIVCIVVLALAIVGVAADVRGVAKVDPRTVRRLGRSEHSYWRYRQIEWPKFIEFREWTDLSEDSDEETVDPESLGT
jgi:hypothetical protein